jgi:ATP diphosphatase
MTSPVNELIEVMRRLRDPDGGGPWDIEQTFETIAPYTIEEAYEVADAIASGSRDDLKGELGDLLLQVVYHSRMAEEEGTFAFDDVARTITEKMISRHPHVFGDEVVVDADAQTERWEAAKAAERASSGGSKTSALDGVALALPALVRAQKLQRRAARVGFDWPDSTGVTDKIAEEAKELADEIQSGTPEKITEEFGDLLFTVAVLGQHLGVDAEQALASTNRKFERRFRGVEDRLSGMGKSPAESTLEEMDTLWDAVKKDEKSAIVT